jgi:nucleoid-associated protein YgaU
MGLFDFVANAGEKITNAVLGDTPDAADVGKTAEVSQDRIDQLRKDSITRSISQLDIDGEVVQVAVSGDKVTLTGTAPSDEDLEKMVLCAGNQHGIAQVDCQLEVAGGSAAAAAPAAAAAEAGPGGSAFYTVQSGDTLGKIAQEHYGSAGKYMVIFEANKPMLTDPNKIYPGQKLRIPPQ